MKKSIRSIRAHVAKLKQRVEAIERLRTRVTEALDDACCDLDAVAYKRFIEMIGFDVMHRQYAATVAVITQNLRSKSKRNPKARRA